MGCIEKIELLTTACERLIIKQDLYSYTILLEYVFVVVVFVVVIVVVVGVGAAADIDKVEILCPRNQSS